MSLTIDQEIVLERYRYVLARKRDLNDGTFKIITVYQAGVAVLTAGFCSLLLAKEGAGISDDLYRLGALSTLFLFWLVTVFSALMIVGGMLAWFGYRREECEIEEALDLKFASRPTVKGFLKWYESYFLIFMFALAVLSTFVIVSEI